ncbi:MAG: murein biosynthesis integral membrane protein MurJ [Patescibacteria group bacterium]
MSRKAIISGSILLGASALISRVLGLARDHLLASNFGALGSQGIYNLDTYYAAFRLPDLVFNLVVYGTLSSAFVPIFVQYLKKNETAEANQFGSAVLTISTVLITALSALIALFAPLIVPLLVPGFDGERLELTITLTRIMALSPIFFTISAFFQSLQNSHQTFIYYSIAPIVYNLSIIVGIVFFSKNYGVTGIAWGVVAGALLHACVQLPALRKLKFSYIWNFDYQRRDFREMIALTIPRVIGLSISQFNLLIETFIGSLLISGSITIMNYATNLQSLPLGVIGISAAIASFSTLAGEATKNNISAFSRVVSENVERVLFLIIPATLGMLSLRFQIVRLVFGRGKFTWEDTILTSNTLGILLIGLAAHSLIFLLARAFYSWKDTKTPVAISIGSVAVNILFSLYFTQILSMGVYGLATANAIAGFLNCMLLFIFLRKKLAVKFRDLIPAGPIMHFLFASAIMLLAVQVAKVGTGMLFNDIDTYLELTIQTLTSIAVGAGAYFGCIKVFRDLQHR